MNVKNIFSSYEWQSISKHYIKICNFLNIIKKSTLYKYVFKICHTSYRDRCSGTLDLTFGTSNREREREREGVGLGTCAVRLLTASFVLGVPLPRTPPSSSPPSSGFEHAMHVNIFIYLLFFSLYLFTPAINNHIFFISIYHHIIISSNL